MKLIETGKNVIVYKHVIVHHRTYRYGNKNELPKIYVNKTSTITLFCTYSLLFEEVCIIESLKMEPIISQKKFKNGTDNITKKYIRWYEVHRIS